MNNPAQNPSIPSATEQLDTLRNTIALEEQQWLKHYKARLAEEDRLKAELQLQLTEQAECLALQQRQLTERAKALEPESAALTPAPVNTPTKPGYYLSEDAFIDLEKVNDGLALLAHMAASATEHSSEIPAQLLAAHLSLLLTPLQAAVHSAEWQSNPR